MRRLIAAIARALASAARTVLVKCAETGKWIVKSVLPGSGAANPGPGPLEELELDIAQDARQAAVTAPAVDRYDRIQTICRDMSCGDTPAREDLAGLSEFQREWIETMPSAMRLIIGNVPREDLIAHVRGKKPLRGIIPCDRASLEDWRHSAEIEAVIMAGAHQYQADAPAMTMH
tara:strand:- start:37471 stop:37995 length:525 start_codon:yes stop_codon:yes gene_type:complete